MKKVLEHYEKFLKEELEGKSGLHLKKGFLKEFGYICQCKPKERLQFKEGEWHDPVDNPQITMYMQSGGYWPKYAAFGYTRKETRKPYGQHQGLDIFALDDGKTNVYACLSGKIVYAGTAGAYGKLIVLEISEKQQLDVLKKRKRDYTLRYKNSGEESKGKGFSEDSNKMYFRYSHLSKILVSVNDKVDVGQKIGISGTTGVPGGTCGPHVHFEIASSISGSMIENRVNPGYYVYYKNEEEMSEEEKKIQINRKSQGNK